MARFFGVVGFSEGPIEIRPGVWDDVIVEHNYRGDVVRNTAEFTQGQGVLDDITLGESIRIVADEFARGHIAAMRYVRWRGALWKITQIEVVRPRLLLRLGGVYNGPTP